MKKTFKFQRREGTTAEHCCVPLCTSSAKFNSSISFHTFPSDDQQRKRWIVNIRRENLIISHHTRVCSRHFVPEEVTEPTGARGRRRLKPGAVPVLFPWNNDSLGVRNVEVWEQRSRPESVETGEDAGPICANDHNYSAAPDPAFVASVISDNESFREKIVPQRQQLEQLSLKLRFGLQRFAGSDEDIRFYTGFWSYDHLMRFWQLIETPLHFMGPIARARTANTDSAKQSAATTQALQPIDELFLLLNYLALGPKQRDLADQFGVHQSTVSRIILMWSSFLFSVLGSQQIWIPQDKIIEHLPGEFKDYPDTTVILDCTELRCQTPASPLLQSDVYSNYKPHCTLRGMIGMAPHGAVTFVSPLFAGSVSDKQIFLKSGIVSLLRPDMAVMVDRCLLVDDCVPCKVYRSAFPAGRPQMPADEVRETPSAAHLRVHVESLIRRLKEHKFFDKVIPLNMFGNINQLYVVACLLLNYQSGPLVKAWSK
ncbi:uncharacterized protein [Trachinotus anak]|uniref:uncharacterized protein n=1 Tax=Trachinotus anak TaxID=443729 RepID=UPI0039F17D95